MIISVRYFHKYLMSYRDTIVGLISSKKNVHCLNADSKGEGKEVNYQLEEVREWDRVYRKAMF